MAETDRSVTVADHRSVITSVRRRRLEDFQVQLRYRPRSLSAGILLFVSYLCQELVKRVTSISR